MREDRIYGHSDPSSRKDVVLAAANLYCSICDSTPCYLLTSAATSVVHEQLTENDCSNTTNLISAVHYTQSPDRLHMCIAKHIDVTREAWHMDNHSRISEDALREIERQGWDPKQLKENLLKETRSEDPPSLN